MRKASSAEGKQCGRQAVRKASSAEGKQKLANELRLMPSMHT